MKMLFHIRIFNEMLSTEYFPQNIGKSQWGKIKESKLNILSMGRIARQQLLDISADYLTNNIGV